MHILLAILVAYFLGTIPTALIVVYFLCGMDVRKSGSGNMGAMNTVRILKKHKGIKVAFIGFLIVWLGDMVKAIIAVIIIQLLISDFVTALSIATFFVILGHNYPIFLKFKGGRGAASFMGILLFFSFKIFISWILTIFVFMVLFEAAQTIIQQKKFTKQIIFYAISEQIIGRLFGELCAICIIYLIDGRLFIPAILGTSLIVISHHKRLSSQIMKLLK